MQKAPITWLLAITMTFIYSAAIASQQTAKPTEKLVGTWDNHSGIISFFVKDVGGIKHARMVLADEHVDERASKLSINMQPVDLDELEEIVEDTLRALGNPEELPIPPIGTKETSKRIGNLVYPNARITFTIVDPAETQRYATLVVKEKDERIQHVYWMNKEDLVALEKLFESVVKVLGKD